jgi:hypothetical protein
MSKVETPEARHQKRSPIISAWQRWLSLWVPFMALILIAMHWIQFSTAMVCLILLLMATLLYQRFAKRRSWRSILWGDHVKGE